MLTTDPRHGSYAGASHHRIHGPAICAPCLRAERTRHALNVAARLAGNPATVPAHGTVRRLRALQAIGWTIADIARRTGLSEKTLRNPLIRGQSVRRATAAAVTTAYNDLSMIVPVGGYHTRCRNWARRDGYPPPLAWNNIDDPDEEPTAWAYEPINRHTDPSERAETVRELTELGVGISEACWRLGVNREALEKWCRHHAMTAEYLTLAGRERLPNAQWERRAS